VKQSYLDVPEQHRTKLHSTNPLERLNKEVKRRADVVGIFPNEASSLGFTRRLYCDEGLQLPSKTPKRKVSAKRRGTASLPQLLTAAGR